MNECPGSLHQSKTKDRTDEMTRNLAAFAGATALIASAGCVSTQAPPSAGLSDNAVAPAGMREACVAQAVRLTGVPASGIVTRPPIEVGPDRRAFIGMSVAGASYGCRIENDGSYTVFSQFAN